MRSEVKQFLEYAIKAYVVILGILICYFLAFSCKKKQVNTGNWKDYSDFTSEKTPGYR